MGGGDLKRFATGQSERENEPTFSSAGPELSSQLSPLCLTFISLGKLKDRNLGITLKKKKTLKFTQ